MRHRAPLLLVLASIIIVACTDLATLRSSQPIAPVRDYEILLVGNLDANYIGDENCLAKCHSHDKLANDFKHSIHGEQISEETGLPLVNCESCHGPGSLSVVHAEEKKVCDFSTLLPLAEFPAQAQSMLCLKCHSAASTPNLTSWNASTHALNGVGCFDCHKLHKGPQQKVSRHEQEKLCNSCHSQVKMEFSQFSHHPVPEHKMACTDCHDPHLSTNRGSLKGITSKALCTRCHMEYQGPFVYEHADVTEECTNCHQPHGSSSEPLLEVSEPFLCMQCHSGHNAESLSSLKSPAGKQAFFTRCSDCHSAIHGTNIPSSHGRGSFISR